MDVVLDILDTFVMDWLYAAVLPGPNPITKDAGSGFQETYNQHVGLYISLKPSPYVDGSIWKRDHIARQATSLFLIAW
jgi:lathosterol oxidase